MASSINLSMNDIGPSDSPPDEDERPEARPTRFRELGYRQDAPSCWRIVMYETGAAVGPQYKTRAELLADLDRFASLFGATL